MKWERVLLGGSLVGLGTEEKAIRDKLLEMNMD